MFGQPLVIHGPEATVDTPNTVTFTIDASVLGGVAPADVQVWRDGEALADCTDPVAAVPDACVAERKADARPDAAGDAQVTVRTSHFSTWTLGAVDYDLVGPFAPVDPGVTNTAKAGSAVPVKFRLGGDQGLDVLSAGYPKVVASTCVPASDELEQTSPAGASALTYDAASATYTYTWKTAKSSTGCKDLVLKFRDGSVLRAQFRLR